MVFSRIVTRKSYIILIIVLALQFALGCGSGDTNSGTTDCVAPAGSTITINPASQPITVGGGVLGADVLLDWSVTVAYADGKPMPDACIRITGAFAVTTALPTNYALYQFLYYPSWVSPNVPVDSGFTAKTDAAGQYTFSTFISAGTLTFYDAIYVVSGTNMGTAKIEITQ